MGMTIDSRHLQSDDFCVSCTGRSIGTSAMALVASKVEHLKGYCPSDSFIEITINKGDGYSMDLVVRGACLEIIANGKGEKLPDAISEAFGSVHSSLREWRKDRFACPSRYATGHLFDHEYM